MLANLINAQNRNDDKLPEAGRQETEYDNGETSHHNQETAAADALKSDQKNFVKLISRKIALFPHQFLAYCVYSHSEYSNSKMLLVN